MGTTTTQAQNGVQTAAGPAAGPTSPAHRLSTGGPGPAAAERVRRISSHSSSSIAEAAAAEKQ